jgi:adenylylsulfate kinase-like enzyme
MKKKVCIIFAGAVGSSKTPISNYLSIKLNLPIFNNDAIRSEVIEDLGFFDSNEHIKRRNSRLEEIIKV